MTDMAQDILYRIRGCEDHDHAPVAIEMQRSAYVELAQETIKTPLCFNWDCDHPECGRLRRALQAKPGDEGNSVWGLEIRIVPDVPLVRIIERDA